jgi:hypothetical protein
MRLDTVAQFSCPRTVDRAWGIVMLLGGTPQACDIGGFNQGPNSFCSTFGWQAFVKSHSELRRAQSFGLYNL